MDKPEEDKMPFTSHLEELRNRLVRILIVVAVGFGACWFFRNWLFAVITRPLFQVLPQQSTMIFTGLTEAFFTYMKISLVASLVFTSPYTFYQIWKFVAPGLYPREKRYVLPFVIASSLLFLGGVLFGYFIVLPPAFEFFVSFASDQLKPLFVLREYLSLALKFLLGFGLSFELPVFIFFLTKVGVVNPRLLAKQRRYAILLIFIAAAVLTPSPDAISQILMAIPLMILYEASIYVSKWAEKKRPGKEADEGAGQD